MTHLDQVDYPDRMSLINTDVVNYSTNYNLSLNCIYKPTIDGFQIWFQLQYELD